MLTNEKEREKLKNYVSDSGEYLIPVEWSVYSTVKIKADNLLDAVEKFQKVIDDVPLCTEPEYIDDSYRASGDTAEDYVNAQHYRNIGNIEIDENGKIEVY